MKINYKKYARALFEAIEKAETEQEKKRIAKNFAKVLLVNNSASQIDKIELEFNKLQDSKEGRIKAEIIAKEKLGKELLSEIENYIKKKTDAKVVDLVEKQDKNVLGGFIIRAGDMILDASLKSRLREVKGKMQ